MNRIKKPRCGNAYVVVVFVSLAVISVALATLSVTAASRNTTARYSNFAGLYDLAVAGTEQMFNFMAREFEKHGDMSLLVGRLAYTFDSGYWGYRREWRLAVDFHCENGETNLRDYFRAFTTVRAVAGGRFYIETRIGKYYGGGVGQETVVRSTVLPNALDVNTLEMVELLRLAN
ncbi:MAG: hypothetical protein FWB96_05075 [Defluviitaleaceae bacterium]|nr:hypothetical protein [Defluviitaleaceae bacterium]MCL2262194.1 hypothetical protein [Defluviitaleaceae bacterium]